MTEKTDPDKARDALATAQANRDEAQSTHDRLTAELETAGRELADAEHELELAKAAMQEAAE